jgi:hypothetical protein
MAQMIDGSLGMAYGVSSSTLLIAVGVIPPIASASVHASEIFTTLVSGGSHFKFGNVRRDIILPLIVMGIPGGIAGAFMCVAIPAKPLKPIVSSILLLMGFLIFYKFTFGRTFQFRTDRLPFGRAGVLGFFAAVIDALGGGGWGPIATPSLIVNNIEPSKAIGSVNFAEFFITVAETLTFLALIGPESFRWDLAFSLMVGGVIAAPVAAFTCKKVPHKILGQIVGLLVIVLNIRTILMSFGLL